ncbi:MAG: cell division protein FtsH [Zetaproteobacteria bacterium CG_4_9_14_3_um_filter_49_83]|nr:MAG: cell division protein FtsH [Zetaproteobacteria bacterium CG1_02_49_23]PIQ34080.1 MAG: cell division protein FtsH [Zetaproteobacteria bacterium CG17_big_fil_post_rev_8_21_14_2_50_50_13]PIV30243.1 MAG: cell division protein FtsH [Zetaproteobacteria bacterium CG02_land_8_20_14_3_00_50_9]PIY55872.1 MAG: cell division protein FtsH [Zetaproteobacteria bacterium CG_4_10_14_0_8_um_filter_49_80]PJA35002.1 MAG: cell division protein FtsH [Zetaproteobacteria bacterium CG_4_9_14_3_um_filter_49_83]
MGKNVLLWVVIGLTMMSVFNMFNSAPMGRAEGMTYSSFMDKVNQGMIDKATISEHEIRGQFTDMAGDLKTFAVEIPNDPNLVQRLLDNKVEVDVKPPAEVPFLLNVLISWFPMLLLIAVWVFFMRQMQGGGKGGAMGFGKSRAKMLTENTNRVTFEDVAGCDEAKQEVTEIIEFLRDPSRFTRLGGRIPKGVLLVGPPGTGKTLLGRAIAGEAEVPFFSISGSDFVEMFVGVGASRVRDMFEQAKKHAPCIVFVDEIDAMGRHRGAGIGGGNDEREQTLNQMLVEMDGFEANEGVILVAATNRPDVLDPALLRPGRFDRQVVVGRPDLNGRVQILKVHMKKVPLASDVKVKVIARGTPGFSGADLANLVNEAALNAARFDRDKVAAADFDEAKDKVMMGTERRSMAMTEDEKKLTAYHEGGHALVSIHCAVSDPIHKMTIIPRGQALGMVMRLPERDEYSQSREKMHGNIAIAMGGRVAEEMIFGYDKVTSGASSDIQMATNLAKSMVTKWGMSDKLGPLLYSDNEQEVFLGHSVAQQTNVSDETARLIDSEVRSFVEGGYARAKRILEENIDQLHLLAEALLEYETLTGDEITQVLQGKILQRADVINQSAKASEQEDASDDATLDEVEASKSAEKGASQES